MVARGQLVKYEAEISQLRLFWGGGRRAPASITIGTCNNFVHNILQKV